MQKLYSTLLYIFILSSAFTNFGQNKMPDKSLSKPFLWTYQLPDEDVIGPMDVSVSGTYYFVREIVGEKIHANINYKIDKMVFTPKFGDLRFKYKGRIYKANEVAGTDGLSAMLGWGDVKITGVNISIKAVGVKNGRYFDINSNLASAYDIGEVGRDQDLNNLFVEEVGSYATAIYFNNSIGLQTRLDKLERLVEDREDYKKYISDANSYYNSDDLANARINYQNASKLLPRETYPQSQIAKIDAQLKADAAKKLASQNTTSNTYSTTKSNTAYNNTRNSDNNKESNTNISTSNNSTTTAKSAAANIKLSPKIMVSGIEAQLYENGGRYYVLNSDGTEYETTKASYDKISAAAYKAQASSSNSPVTPAPITNSQLLNTLTALNPNNKGLNEFATNYAQGEQIAQVTNGLIDLFSASPEEKARKERERQAAAEREEAYRQAQLKLQYENEQKAKSEFSEIIKTNPPINETNKNYLVITLMDNYISEKYNTDVSSLIPEWKNWMTDLISNNDHYSSTVFAGKALGFNYKKFDYKLGISETEALTILEKVGNSSAEYIPYMGISFDIVKKSISEKNKKKKTITKEVNTFKISKITPGTSAEASDLKVNDVIVKFNNAYQENLHEKIRSHKIGDKVTLTILRDNKEIIKDVKIGSTIKNHFKVDAILTLANYYNLKEKGNDPEKALYYFTKAAENGSPIAMYALGEIYQNLVYGNKKVNVKFKFKKNEEFALDWYLKSIENPNYITSAIYKHYKIGSTFEPQSYDELITMYKKGIGCKKSPEKADEILILKNNYLAENTKKP